MIRAPAFVPPRPGRRESIKACLMEPERKFPSVGHASMNARAMRRCREYTNAEINALELRVGIRFLELEKRTDLRFDGLKDSINSFKEVMTTKFEVMMTKFEEMDKRFGEMDKRFDIRFGELEKRIDVGMRRQKSDLQIATASSVIGLLLTFGGVAWHAIPYILPHLKL